MLSGTCCGKMMAVVGMVLLFFSSSVVLAQTTTKKTVKTVTGTSKKTSSAKVSSGKTKKTGTSQGKSMSKKPVSSKQSSRKVNAASSKSKSTSKTKSRLSPKSASRSSAAQSLPSSKRREDGGPNRALFAAFRRIALARMYQGTTWTLPGETPASVGEVLASLNPSTVSGLVAVGGGGDSPDSACFRLTTEQVAAFTTVRKQVRAVNPECRFDCVVNLAGYATPDVLLVQMKDINEKIMPDFWFFESLALISKTHPEIIEAAIRYAHAHGQAVGGDWSDIPIPTGIDFVSVEVLDFKLNTGMTRKMHETLRIPVVAHLNNRREKAGQYEEAKQFVQLFTPEKRLDLITYLASGQLDGKYLLMYPVFFPEYPSGHAYNASKDGTLLENLRKTMKQFNP